jgi:hypothetical protein
LILSDANRESKGATQKIFVTLIVHCDQCDPARGGRASCAGRTRSEAAVSQKKFGITEPFFARSPYTCGHIVTGF